MLLKAFTHLCCFAVWNQTSISTRSYLRAFTSWQNDFCTFERLSRHFNHFLYTTLHDYHLTYFVFLLCKCNFYKKQRNVLNLHICLDPLWNSVTFLQSFVSGSDAVSSTILTIQRLQSFVCLCSEIFMFLCWSWFSGFRVNMNLGGELVFRILLVKCHFHL